jgi:phosphate starvation-inducible protein PhoH and related proteins
LPRKTNESSKASKAKRNGSKFHIEFLSTAQRTAWASFQQHDVLFLVGPAGVGKTHLAMAFAINEVLNGSKDRIILTRPIVESGESLGYLPGDFHEKVNPYMLPLYDCMHKLVGKDGPQSDKVRAAAEVAPLAYMRGRTFDDAVCIFDEAQNATREQLKLFMSRFGENSKIIITGDPMQSDIGRDVALTDVVRRLESLSGVGIIEFKNNSIVRHPLVGSILERLSKD